MPVKDRQEFGDAVFNPAQVADAAPMDFVRVDAEAVIGECLQACELRMRRCEALDVGLLRALDAGGEGHRGLLVVAAAMTP